MKKIVCISIVAVVGVILVGCSDLIPRRTSSNPSPGFQRVATGPSTEKIQDELLDEELFADEDDGVDTEGTNLPEIIVDEAVEIPMNDSQELNLEAAEEIIVHANGVGDIDELAGEEAIIIPDQVNLDIPFYAQAPDGDWSLPRKEACEESSLILARYYLADERLTKSIFKEEVLRMVEIEKQLLGKYIDTSVEETQRIYEAMYPNFGQTKIIENPTIEQLKIELAQGHPIVAPFAGKELGNSNFTNGGPRYHMLVIRGYDDTYFYTNDVGTRRGDNFPYTYDVIMGALHDLVPVGEGDIREGKKKILVLMND